jgi:hypothetical protein
MGNIGDIFPGNGVVVFRGAAVIVDITGKDSLSEPVAAKYSL